MGWKAIQHNLALYGGLMTIKSWLKKTGAALSLAGALSGCDMLFPEGVAVKQEADGVLSAEEQQITEHALSSKEKVNDFLPFRPLVNDFNVFMGNELASQGLDRRRFDDDMHVYMVRDEAEMIEKRRFVNREWVPPAFHSDSNATLYILQNNELPADFAMTVTHEAGHHFRASAYEFPSKAHEMYFAFRAYGFNRRIGSLFAGFSVVTPYPMVSNPIQRCLPIDEYFVEHGHKYYVLGDLGFLVQANLEDGNLEKAFNNILTRPKLYLEKTTVDAARQYSDVCRAGLGEFNKLLEKPGFMQGILRNMSRNEADEFVNYMRLNALNITYSMMESESLPINSADKDNFVQSMEMFLDSNPANPYFKGQVTSILSYEYAIRANAIFSDPAQMNNMEGKIKAHNLAKRIIELNRDYPCEYRFYDCMGEASEIRVNHALGYRFATINAEELIPAGIETYDSLIALSEEFNRKFYPTGNYHFEDTNKNLVVYSPYIFLSAGILEEETAHIALRRSDQQEYTTHMCKAIKWFEATVDAGCSRIPDAEINKELKTECEAALGSALEQSAQIRIDNSQTFYEENCRIY